MSLFMQFMSFFTSSSSIIDRKDPTFQKLIPGSVVSFPSRWRNLVQLQRAQERTPILGSISSYPKLEGSLSMLVAKSQSGWSKRHPIQGVQGKFNTKMQSKKRWWQKFS